MIKNLELKVRQNLKTKPRHGIQLILVDNLICLRPQNVRLETAYTCDDYSVALKLK